MYDRIIRGGQVIDGTGNPPFRADVAVKDGKIAFVGLLPPEAQAEEVLDAQGQEIELKDDDEDNYTPDHSHDDDFGFGYDQGGEAEFQAAGYTLKEGSDDDDLAISDGDEDDDFSDGDDMDFLSDDGDEE